MGRIIIPIGINIESVKNIFGTKDELLLNNILQSDFYKKFEDEFSFKRELVDIVFNYIPVENRVVKPSKFFGLIKGNDGGGLEGEWNDYGYALLTLCCYLGNKFSENDDEFIYADSWWKINTLLRENGSPLDLSRMLESRKIFDTPFAEEEIYSNHYNKIEVVDFITHILQIENQIENEDFKLFNSLKTGLLNCKEKQLDLVIFSYEFGDL